jgi:histidine triad (HIT) family protein
VAVASCVFCDIICGSSPAGIVYVDDLAVAFMDIRSINAGHLLIVPRTHSACLSEMDKATGGHLFQIGPEYSRLPDRVALDEVAERIRRVLEG